MKNIKINEQIAFLRKQKGITQEELAKALGVTNQAVSKWESAQCCPDIQLLPEIAQLFEVSVDQLLGYKGAEGLGDICLKIKEYFIELRESEAFENAYRIAALLHEVATTDGYKKYIPWMEKDYVAEDISSWGTSICSEPEGCTVRMNNSISFSLGKAYVPPKAYQLQEMVHTMERFADIKLLKVMYSLYGLSLESFDLYITVSEIASRTHLKKEEVEDTLQEIPVTVKEEGGEFLYRLEGSFCHMPSLLMFLGEK